MSAQVYRTTVKLEQIDVLGHLNNAEYLRLFEAARWHVLARREGARQRFTALGVSPVIQEIKLRFVREVLGGETLEIHSEFTRVGERRFTATQRMVDEGGQLRAVASLSGTFFDVTSRKTVAPPAELIELLDLPEKTLVPPTVQGLGGAFLDANDADALAAWYTLVLGLEFETGGKARWVELPSADRVPHGRLATTTFALFQADAPLPAARTGRVNFRVPDLEPVVAAAASAGARTEMGHEDYGRFAWVWDPEGNRVELWEPPRESRD